MSGLRLGSLDRARAQSVAPLQDVGEELLGHRDLSQLEDDVPGVPHDPVADLPLKLVQVEREDFRLRAKR